jgi:HK97 family phage major capsid protein
MPDIDKFLQLQRELTKKYERVAEIRANAKRENRMVSRRERAELETITRDAVEFGRRVEQARGGSFDPRLAQGDSRLGDESNRGDLLAPEQRMADWVQEHRGSNFPNHDADEFSLGRIARAMVHGDHSSLTDVERRALVEGTDSAGGFLIPELLSATMIDRVRNQARVFEAGATTVPMTVDQLNLARLTGGASVAWKTEGNAITASDMVFDRVVLQARTLPILVKMSQELFDDLSPSASALIEGEIASALALELDRVALRGSGTPPEPKGIRNQTGVNIQSLGTNGAQLAGYDDVSTAIGTVRTANGEPNAVVLSARSMTFLEKMKDSTGQPLQPPPFVKALRFLVSNQVPDNLTQGSWVTASEAYVGYWPSLLVGLRTDLRLRVRVLSERFADNLQVGLLAYLRADVAIAHPELFTVITGIKP